MNLIVTCGVLVCALASRALIIPDELPSLLSIIYSNIPTLKKGTDSRIGWGFRLGDRADFQVMLELGPQTNTQPLANQEDKNSNSKRNTVESLAEILYAQRQNDKRQNQQKKKKKITSDSSHTATENSAGAEWLENWSKTVTQKKQVVPLKAKPGLAIGEIDAASIIRDESDELVQKKEISTKIQSRPSTSTDLTIIDKKPLDDVNLDYP